MNVKTENICVMQWLHVETLMGRTHVTVLMVTLEMDKVAEVRIRNLQKFPERV